MLSLVGQLGFIQTQEQDDNFTEVVNYIHSVILTKNPACVTSAFGSQMVIPSEWKGMNTAQIEEIKKLNN